MNVNKIIYNYEKNKILLNRNIYEISNQLLFFSYTNDFKEHYYKIKNDSFNKLCENNTHVLSSKGIKNKLLVFLYKINNFNIFILSLKILNIFRKVKK